MKAKKLLVAVLCVVMALTCFTACGGKETATGGTIKVGFLGPKTGGVAQYGLAVEQGVLLYVDNLNKAGGINGKTVEVVSYDEEGDQAKALIGYGDLLDKGVVGIVGDVTTGPCVAVAQEAYNDGTPMITASATAASVTFDEKTNTVYTNMFRSCFIDPFQGETMAKFAKEDCGAKTAAVLYNKDDTYSTGVYENFEKTCKAIGLNVVAVEKYDEGKAGNTAPQLTNIKNANPDVLFLPIYYNDVALIADKANEIGFSVKMLGVDGWSSVLDTVDSALVEDSYYCSGYSPTDTGALVQKFLKDYAAKYPNEGTPNMFVAQGYDAAWILCDAIAKAEAAGKTAGTDDYSKAVIAAMAATDSDYVTGHVVYDSHNDPQKTAAIIHITGGKEEFWGNK